MKYFRCDRCGNLMEVIEDSGYVPSCCNEPMRLLENNTFKLNEHSIEYRIYPITDGISRVRVCIGKDDLHPMKSDHYIKFISIKTNRSVYTRFLKENEKPCASFLINEHEKVKSICEYCKVHGLYEINLDIK